MAKAILVSMLFEAWKDLDRALTGLSEEGAATRLGGGSAFSWTAAHVTNQLDNYVNVRFQDLPPHSLLSQPTYRFGGTGEAVGGLAGPPEQHTGGS